MDMFKEKAYKKLAITLGLLLGIGISLLLNYVGFFERTFVSLSKDKEFKPISNLILANYYNTDDFKEYEFDNDGLISESRYFLNPIGVTRNKKKLSDLSDQERIVYENYIVKNGNTVLKFRSTENSKQLRLEKEYQGKKPILFFGCSYIWGTGLDDEETIVSFMNKHLPQYDSVNLGIRGGAVNHSLRLFDEAKSDFANYTKGGIAIYFMIENHFERIVGTKNWVSLSSYHMDGPLFLIENDSLKYKGKFHENLKIIENSKVDKNAYNLMLRMIRELEKKLVKIYGIKDFVIVFYPMEGGEHLDNFEEHLLKDEFRVLDYSSYNFRSILKGKDRLIDGHPSGEANELLALMIKHDLIKKGIID